MRIELLCTGDELLDGSVVDTNSAWLAGELFARGAAPAHKETVPDDLEAIAAAFRRQGERADFIVSCGGLGPTCDDLTVEAAALAAGVPMETDQAILTHLRDYFARKGFTFTPNNERQARVPRGATPIINGFGTAPIIRLRIGRAETWLLPGVPREFRELCKEQVLPRIDELLAQEPGRLHRAARTIKVFGIGESMLETKVSELPARHPHVRFGYRTHAPENHLKLLAEGESADEARARLAAVEAEARALIGSRAFGVDGEELPEVAFRALLGSRATVALAESCTGGLLASVLTAIPGASEVLVSSAVVYQERAKSQLLGLDAGFVEREGAVSAPVTRALAEAARERAQATFGLAITGWAGPGGGTAADPVGTVYLCLTDGAKRVELRREYRFDRERVQRFAAWQALDLLRLHAKGICP